VKPEEARLLKAVATMARELPRGIVEELCDALGHLPDNTTQRQRAVLSSIVSSHGARAQVADLVGAWNAAPHVSPVSLMWSLRAASDVDEHHRREQSIELVWTGPAPGNTTFRRTDQALLDLIRTAQRELYVVTFAAYKIPILNEAMLAAARRGVEIHLVFESQDAGKTAFAAIKAMGEELEALSNVYIWPPEKRPKDAAGRHGSLHAKCAVSDGTKLLVSSANLTEYALSMNMELGVLLRGGRLPGRVKEHLQRLITEGMLTSV
jgi:phosphatidylserine/phosphatidylglycerophosphate/cardiolipin synthase-like enzyme